MSSKKAAIRQAVQAGHALADRKGRVYAAYSSAHNGMVPVADSDNWSRLLASFTDSKGRRES